MDAGEPADEPADEPEGDEEEMLEEARGISYVPSQKEIVKTVAKELLLQKKRAEARLIVWKKTLILLDKINKRVII